MSFRSNFFTGSQQAVISELLELPPEVLQLPADFCDIALQDLHPRLQRRPQEHRAVSAAAVSCGGPLRRCAHRPRVIGATRGPDSRDASDSSTCSTSSRSSNACIRSVRPRNSPTVCGPRSISTPSTACSRRPRLSTSPSRWEYFSTRCPAPLILSTRPLYCNDASASITERFSM